MTYLEKTGARLAAVIMAGLLGVVLSGCSTNNGILGGSVADSTPAATAPAAVAQQQPARAKIAIAPIIGAPDSVSKQLASQLGQSIQAQRVSIGDVKDTDLDYTLRGYVVATRETGGTKLSYIWDVMDPNGRRVNRITGEQNIKGANGSDAWASVSPAVVQTIAEKTSSSFGTWLPNKPSQAAIASRPASGVSPAAVGAPVAAAAASSAIPATPTLKPQLAALKPAGNTSAATGPVSAIVPSVTGAPGDGRVSLTSALQRELSRGGVALAGSRGANTYQVVGRVKVGTGSGGKQPIQIDWRVKDPKGKTLGTVSQKNQIPQGSLDGAWGKTADAAAAAAAQGILKLLPKTVASN